MTDFKPQFEPTTIAGYTEAIARALLAAGVEPAAVLSAAQRLGLRRPPLARRVAGLSSAVVVGLSRPVVAVPAAADTWSADELEHVLLHECAHVARRDALWRAVLLSVQAVFWFHPLSWLLVARLTALLELFADGRVARRGGRCGG